MPSQLFRCGRLITHRTHQVPFISQQILSDPAHVLFPRVRQRFPFYFKLQPPQPDRTQGLWVVVSVRLPEKGTKLVVRNWLKRRFAVAFWGELKGRGYGNIRGMHLGPQGDNGGGRYGVRELRGHADVFLSEDFAKMKGPEVKEQASKIVDTVIRHCGV